MQTNSVATMQSVEFDLTKMGDADVTGKITLADDGLRSVSGTFEAKVCNAGAK